MASYGENHAEYLWHWTQMSPELQRVLLKVLSDARMAADLATESESAEADAPPRQKRGGWSVGYQQVRGNEWSHSQRK